MASRYIVILENNENDKRMLIQKTEEALYQLPIKDIAVKGFLRPADATAFLAQNDCCVFMTSVELCGANGLAIAKNLQQSKPECNIILVTAYEEYALEALQMHLHICGYLVKPVETKGIAEQLLNLIHPVLSMPETNRTA